jgi:hypothetical protein
LVLRLHEALVSLRNKVYAHTDEDHMNSVRLTSKRSLQKQGSSVEPELPRGGQLLDARKQLPLERVPRDRIERPPHSADFADVSDASSNA